MLSSRQINLRTVTDANTHMPTSMSSNARWEFLQTKECTICTCAEIAWVTVYSVSALNCLHKDLHCTGVISVSCGET